MDPVTIAGLAGAGASLFGGLVNNAFADARSDKQWNRTLYMQDKMNAYNAPVAQMERLAQAGLNPNLVYGNGGSVIQSAGGNAPNPPNTAPIDTQGVLQMVQTVVNGMLEKDKIQAEKEISEAKNTTTKEVTQMQNTTSERNVDVTTQSNEKVATERNETEKEINKDRIQSNEKIASENRAENARQFDLSFAHQVSVDNARIAIDRSLANSTIALHSSQIQLNNLSAQLQESIQPYLVNKAKYESLSLAFSYANDRLDRYLALPQYIGVKELGDVFESAGLPRPDNDHLKDIADFHNDQFDVFKISLDAEFTRLNILSSEDMAKWNAFWGAASTPIRLGISAAANVK